MLQHFQSREQEIIFAVKKCGLTFLVPSDFPMDTRQFSKVYHVYAIFIKRFASDSHVRASTVRSVLSLHDFRT